MRNLGRALERIVEIGVGLARAPPLRRSAVARSRVARRGRGQVGPDRGTDRGLGEAVRARHRSLRPGRLRLRSGHGPDRLERQPGAGPRLPPQGHGRDRRMDREDPSRGPGRGRPAARSGRTGGQDLRSRLPVPPLPRGLPLDPRPRLLHRRRETGISPDDRHDAGHHRPEAGRTPPERRLPDRAGRRQIAEPRGPLPVGPRDHRHGHAGREFLHRPVRPGQGPHQLPLLRGRGGLAPRSREARQGPDRIRHPDEPGPALRRGRGPGPPGPRRGRPRRRTLGHLARRPPDRGRPDDRGHGRPALRRPQGLRPGRAAHVRVRLLPGRPVDRAQAGGGLPAAEPAAAGPARPADALGRHRVGHRVPRAQVERRRGTDLRLHGRRGRRAPFVVHRPGGLPGAGRRASSRNSRPTAAATGAPTRTSPRTAG